MIKFNCQQLPYSELVYLALRIAFLDTQERLSLAGQLELETHRTFGYLTQVPFLRNVPAQVQLDSKKNVSSREDQQAQKTAHRNRRIPNQKPTMKYSETVTLPWDQSLKPADGAITDDTTKNSLCEN